MERYLSHSSSTSLSLWPLAQLRTWVRKWVRASSMAAEEAEWILPFSSRSTEQHTCKQRRSYQFLQPMASPCKCMGGDKQLIECENNWAFGSASQLLPELVCFCLRLPPFTRVAPHCMPFEAKRHCST